MRECAPVPALWLRTPPSPNGDNGDWRGAAPPSPNGDNGDFLEAVPPSPNGDNGAAREAAPPSPNGDNGDAREAAPPSPNGDNGDFEAKSVTSSSAARSPWGPPWPGSASGRHRRSCRPTKARPGS